MSGSPRSQTGARRSLALLAAAIGARRLFVVERPPSPAAAPRGDSPRPPAPPRPHRSRSTRSGMKQAAYSDDDVKAMIKAFTDANPNITVNAEFVAVRGAPRQDRHRPGQRQRPVRHGPHGHDVAGRVRRRPDRHRHHRQDPGRLQERRLRRRLDGRRLQGQVLRRARGSTTRSSSSTTRRCSPTRASPAPPRPGTTSSPRPRPSRPRARSSTRSSGSWNQAEAVICDWAEIAGVMGGADFVDDSGAAKFNTGGGLAGAPVHEAAHRPRAHEPGLAGLHRGRRQQARCRRPGRAMALNWTYGYTVLNDKTSPRSPATSTSRRPRRRASIGDGRRERRDEHRRHDQVAASRRRRSSSPCGWPASRCRRSTTPTPSRCGRPRSTNPDVTKVAPDFWAAAKIAVRRSRGPPIVPYYTKLSTPSRSRSRRPSRAPSTRQQALDEVAAKLPDLQK